MRTNHTWIIIILNYSFQAHSAKYIIWLDPNALYRHETYLKNTNNSETTNYCTKTHDKKFTRWSGTTGRRHVSCRSHMLSRWILYNWPFVIVKDQSSHLVYLNICTNYQTCENLNSIDRRSCEIIMEEKRHCHTRVFSRCLISGPQILNLKITFFFSS